MLVFQVYGQKRDEDGDAISQSHMGVKVRHRKISDEASLSVLSDEISSSMSASERIMKDKEIADFASTLTPGAQNAIRAASFAWGYENAARYVKNAMKLEEVKNAAGPAERSNAVVESIQSQAGKNEKASETSKFVWGYYNEDMKEAQAQSSKSEAITQKSHAERREEIQVQPVTSAEAVAMGVAANSHVPSLLYCAGAYRAAEQMREEQALEAKRLQLARLVTPYEERQKAEEEARQKAEKEKAGQAGSELVEKANELALQRRGELSREYEKEEKQLREAIRALDSFSEDEKDKIKKIAAMLTQELSRFLLAHEKKLARRRALRAQLLRWVAFCRGSRKSLLGMPASRLLKLVSLSSILSLGK